MQGRIRKAEGRPTGAMMTEKFALVAFCCVWITLGLALVPRTWADGSGIVPWVWIAACPVAFWLGRRWAGRGLWTASFLTGLAVVLGLGAELGAWTLHPNDLASLLALTLPWWAVSACVGRPGSRFARARLGACLLATGVLASLVWTGSRGGLAAAAIGTLAALVLTSRRRRLLLLSLLLALTLAAAILPSTRGTDFHDSARAWVRDHDAEGFTWRYLTSGRPAIWRQASLLVADFPLFGTGPDSFGMLVPGVYVPPIRRIDLHAPDAHSKPWVDDAHSLYLESAVAFGVPFLLAFLGICGLGLWTQLSTALRVRIADASTAQLVPAAAFGGLLAFLLHGSVDCAAPGTVVYAAGWLALGHACGPRTEEKRPSSRWRYVAMGFLLVLGPIAATIPWLPAERLHHQAVDAVFSSNSLGSDSLGADSEAVYSDDALCRDAWWRERLAVARGSSSTREATAVARCAPGRITDIAALSPRDAGRATAVLEVQPRHPDALRWSLWTQAEASAESLATGYFQYLALRPNDADAKMEFLRRVGRGWLEDHPRLVLALLADACTHGDPGANACLGAGNLARQLGLGDKVADSFYLASEWPGARRLASEASRPTRD